MSNLVNPYRFVSGGADPSITFTWDTENDQALPGGAVFIRASVKQEFDGIDYTELSSGTIPENSAAVASGAQGFHPEPAATNQMADNDLSNASDWTKVGITSVTDDGAGSLNLDEYTITVNTGGGSHRIVADTVISQNGAAYFIAEEGTGRYVNLVRGSGGDDFATFDLQAGAVTKIGGGFVDSLIKDLGGGRYFCFAEANDSVSAFHICISNTGTPSSRFPSFTGASETIIVSHVQQEGGPFPTSPIITSGSTATREADVLDTGIVVTTEFSALLDATMPIVVGSGETITLLGPDATATDILFVDENFNVIMDDGGTPVTVGTSSSGARIKIAYGRDAGDRSASLDGATAVDGDAPAAGHVGENLELGSRVGVNQSRCIHHLTTFFNVKKSDAELEALASSAVLTLVGGGFLLQTTGANFLLA